MKTQLNNNITWTENVIIADADYIDHVAFNLIVNFERMLGRRIPQADLSQWAVDIALDGGLRPGNHTTQVVLIHDKGRKAFENFAPANYDNDINGKAFRDERLGEFIMSAVAVEDIISKSELLLDVVSTVAAQESVKRLMIIPNAEDGELYDQLRLRLRNANDDQHITVFSMQPLMGGNFRQEILGYSLMNSMGISAQELGG